MFLTHHGIKGQKWGVRNGPPYPLGEDNKSKREKESESSGINSDKLIKIGAAAVGATLIGLGAAKLAQAGMLDDLIQVGHAAVNEAVSIGGTDNIDPKTGFKILWQPKSIDDALNSCNYGCGTIRDRSLNCGNTTIAFEMQRRGIDVQGCPNKYGMSISHMGRYFKGLSEESFCTPDVSSSFQSLSDKDYMMIQTGIKSESLTKLQKSRGIGIRNFISKALSGVYPDGARGNMFVPSAEGSHWISWEKVDGKVQFYNPQRPDRDLDMLFGGYTKFDNLSAQLTAIRLDNLSINSDNIKDAVESFGLKHDKDVGSFKAYKNYGDGFIAIDEELKDLLT